jgi:hypothetical protein
MQVWPKYYQGENLWKHHGPEHATACSDLKKFEMKKKEDEWNANRRNSKVLGAKGKRPRPKDPISRDLYVGAGVGGRV